MEIGFFETEAKGNSEIVYFVIWKYSNILKYEQHGYWALHVQYSGLLRTYSHPCFPQNMLKKNVEKHFVRGEVL